MRGYKKSVQGCLRLDFLRNKARGKLPVKFRSLPSTFGHEHSNTRPALSAMVFGLRLLICTGWVICNLNHVCLVSFFLQLGIATTLPSVNFAKLRNAPSSDWDNQVVRTQRWWCLLPASSHSVCPEGHYSFLGRCLA
jgi:hypothetical protein